MCKSKVLAIAIADLHLHDWVDFSVDHSRLKQIAKLVKSLIEKCKSKKVPLIVAGDFFHNPHNLSNIVLEEFANILAYAKKLKVKIIAISGNHDMAYKNTLTHKSCSYINTFSILLENTFKCVDDRPFITSELLIQGIPYLDNNQGFSELLEKRIALAKKAIYKDKLKVLILHTDLPKVKNAFGHELNSFGKLPHKLKLKLKNFDHVIVGHIHVPQKVFKNTTMLGAPYQQTWGDSGVICNYWEIYRDKLVSITIDDMPKFLVGEPKDSGDLNFYRPPEKPSLTEFPEVKTLSFDKKLGLRKLAKNYTKANKLSASQAKILLKFIENELPHSV